VTKFLIHSLTPLCVNVNVNFAQAVASEYKGGIMKKKNRPDLEDKRPKGVLFSSEGSTGWGRIRRLGNYKAGKKEGDFSHLHEKFADPEDAA
jgi:hypothetical protein